MKKYLFSLIVFFSLLGFFHNTFASDIYESFDLGTYPITNYYGFSATTGTSPYSTLNTDFELKSVSLYFKTGNSSEASGTFRIKATTDGGNTYCYGYTLSAPNYDDLTALIDFDFITTTPCTITTNEEITITAETITGIPDIAVGGNSTFGGIYFLFKDNYSIPTIGITHSTPVDNATNVNAYATFAGTYDNDGTYNIIYYKIHNYDCTNCTDEMLPCGVATTGTTVGYQCNYSLATNTHYGITPNLVSTITEAILADSEAPYNITTGLVYETQTPAVSSTCSGFDVGCYLENAISWTFGLSQATLNQFANLTLENSLPFSYVYDMGTLYEELFDDTPQDIDISIAFGSGSIDILTTDQLEAVPFQGTIRTILGALMIFGTAMLIYRKIMGIHDRQEVKQV